MTKLETIKKPETTVSLKGVKLDWLVEDGTVKRVTLTDRKGRSVIISHGESYTNSLKVLQPKPVELQDRVALVGKVSGVKVRELFENEYAATQTRDTLTNYGSADHTLEIKTVKVPVTDDGELAVPDEEIPF